MQRKLGGYTVIEVIIFLGISAVIAAAAMSLISGKQGETDFNQKMRDTQSKIEDWVNDVSTGNSGGDPTQQTCTAPGGSRPTVKAIPPTSTYNPQCTFLGKVLQFTDASNTGTVTKQNENIYAHSVFGRLYKASTSELPTNMAESLPEAAAGNSGSIDLTETFSLTPAHVKDVCGIPQGSSSCTSAHMVGFMNAFNTEQNTQTNGSENLNVYLYNFNGSGAPADQPGGSAALHCMEVANPCATATDPPSLKSFWFCLTDGKRYAKITITSNGGVGASTQLDYLTTC